MTRRLAVNWILCDGYGICAELFPENIRLDPWGYPIVDPDVPDNLVGLARKVVAACPKLALSTTPVRSLP